MRGTPASGKSTLLHLLWAHIIKKEPRAKVHRIVGWQEEASINIDKRLSDRIPGYPAKTTTCLLFDNAECTYWDKSLWESFFKSHKDLDYYRIVLFCSYGSAGFQPLAYDPGTPMNLQLAARVSLAPDEESKDEFGSIGLLLSRDEFDDIINRLPEHGLASDLQDHIFLQTGGHVGAVADILQVIFQKVIFSNSPGSLIYFFIW